MSAVSAASATAAVVVVVVVVPVVVVTIESQRLHTLERLLNHKILAYRCLSTPHIPRRNLHNIQSDSNPLPLDIQHNNNIAIMVQLATKTQSGQIFEKLKKSPANKASLLAGCLAPQSPILSCPLAILY